MQATVLPARRCVTMQAKRCDPVVEADELLAGLIVDDDLWSFHRIVTFCGPSSTVVLCADLPSMRSRISLIACMSPSAALSTSLSATSRSMSVLRPSASSAWRRSARRRASASICPLCRRRTEYCRSPCHLRLVVVSARGGMPADTLSPPASASGRLRKTQVRCCICGKGGRAPCLSRDNDRRRAARGTSFCRSRKRRAGAPTSRGSPPGKSRRPA